MLSADVLGQVDEIFATYHRGRQSPDVAYGVVHHGELIHHGGLRHDPSLTPIGSHSNFRIASMTKSFTAAAVLMLRDEGQLTLDEPVSTYVPEIASFSPAAPDAPPLTLRLLLTMSGGLPWDDPWADRQESLTPEQFSALLLDGVRWSSVPGTAFEYSNLGYAIIGRAVGNIAGAPFFEFVRSRLLDPLDLASTRFAVEELDASRVVMGHRAFGHAWEPVPFDRPGEFSPIGGLYSSVSDVARWMGWLVEAFDTAASPSSAPLSTTSRREMQQAYRFVGMTTMADGAVRSTGYGFGLNVIADARWGDFVSHSGGYPGYGSHMRWHPATGFGVVGLGNVMYASMKGPATDALDAIVQSIAPPARPVSVWPETLDRHRTVHRLLLDWDDDAADLLFSPNLDLDEPRERRRAAIAATLQTLGEIDPEPHDLRSLQSGAEATWTIAGTTGSASVELWLTPERNPKVHTLIVKPSTA